MEAIILKFLPIAIWIGFGLRLFKHNIDKDFPYDKTEQGWKNIKSSIFSGLIVLVIFVLVWVIKADDNINTSDIPGVLSLFGWFGVYIAIGWTPDSILMWIITKGQASTQMIVNNSKIEP
jgi:hypothetical protein